MLVSGLRVANWIRYRYPGQLETRGDPRSASRNDDSALNCFHSYLFISIENTFSQENTFDICCFCRNNLRTLTNFVILEELDYQP